MEDGKVDTGEDNMELQAAADSSEIMMEELEQRDNGTVTITVRHADLI